MLKSLFENKRAFGENTMTKIKICGITNLEDAMLASDLGADALGFIFAESPRRISPKKARKIILSLPPFIAKVGVFVDEEIDVIKEIYPYCGLNLVQLHGNEKQSYLTALSLPVIKTFRVKDDRILDQIKKWKLRCLLLDAFDSTSSGGTGKTFDWEIAKMAAPWGRVILSGGLTPSNVIRALKKVHPYGVDVSSGVEKSPGKKDREKLKKFIQEVRSWNSQTD